MEKKFVNLTYHPISLMGRDGKIRVIEPSGQIARVQFTPVVIDIVDEVPVIKIEYGEVVGLPAPQEGVYYITSATIKNAVGDTRPDVVAGYSVERVDGKPSYAKGVRVNG
jgi:hypothetical protein